MLKKLIKISEYFNNQFKKLIFGRTGKKYLNRRTRRSLYRVTRNNKHAYIPISGGVILSSAAGLYLSHTFRRRVHRQIH